MISSIEVISNSFLGLVRFTGEHKGIIDIRLKRDQTLVLARHGHFHPQPAAEPIHLE